MNTLQIFNATVAFAWQETDSWASLLSNATSNKPVDIYDTGIVYGTYHIHITSSFNTDTFFDPADYYYIVAGNELVSRGLASCSSTGSETGTSSGSTPTETEDGGDAAFRGEPLATSIAAILAIVGAALM